MQQTLVTLPFGLPIYGYGTMLFLAFIGCTWLGIRLGRRVGIAPEVFKDLGLWLFLFGILGARVTYFVFEAKTIPTPWQFIAVWDGGLVFYGSIFGGIVGYIVADHLLQKKYPYDRWKLLDCLAPCIALGLALGRIGCLLNGCCFGNVACETCPAIRFPMSAPPRQAMVERGVQTSAGFTVDRQFQRRVDWVEPGSAAAFAGLLAGDTIRAVNGRDIVSERQGRETFEQLHAAFGRDWERGRNDLELTVERPGVAPRTLVFRPLTVPLHPTQIYETVSMTLMLFFLVSYFPYRAADGILMVILMIGYGLHRFVNELLRTDNAVLAFDMTLSQNISILVLVGGVMLGVLVWLHARGRTHPLRAATVRERNQSPCQGD